MRLPSKFKWVHTEEMQCYKDNKWEINEQSWGGKKGKEFRGKLGECADLEAKWRKCF